ncbi:uncharacterized protein LOC133034637 [Cannabis sativa]|uniref:uncharacterized protein LOC133034637 n=1 Tax=Cannabis sativa TaxID=3483 RepID=UPI0029C9C38A|nr:uncharacterized protein LOC133034637 [Cannabis sativa]
MEHLLLVLYYNGKFVDRCLYTDYQVTGILIPKGFSYQELRTLICHTLELNNITTVLDIQFQIQEGIPPMRIKDDNSCRIYEHIRKKNDNEAAFPLFINYTQSLDTVYTQSLDTVNQLLHQEITCFDITSAAYENEEPYIQDIDPIPTWTDYALSVANYITERTIEATNSSWENKTNIIKDPRIDIIRVGQIFQDKETVKLAMSLYAIKKNEQHRVKRSSTKDYSLVCVDKNCKWYFLATKHGKTNLFKVRKLVEDHTCSIERIHDDHPQATSNIIADCIKKKISNPKRNYRPNEIVDDVAEDYSVSISYQKAWRAKEKASEKVIGCPHDSYNEIPGILHMIKKCNPGTITDLVQHDNGHFKYLFFALGVSIEGWKHCTPLIVVDATFLKNAYGGTLIIASAQDADRHIFPLAFSVVDSENDASWQYFMEKLKESYGEREDQCIISDRHESIAKAMKSVFPNLMHGQKHTIKLTSTIP